MFIAHMPAGYLFTRALLKTVKINRQANEYRSCLFAGLVGSIIPDLDMIRFYLFDNQAWHHHSYLTHKPLFWAGLWGCAILIVKFKGKKLPLWLHIFFSCTLLHLGLDTIAGKIYWLWPFSDHGTTLVTVPPTHSHWILSFLNHWTFKLELVICAMAGVVFIKAQRQSI